MYGNEIFVNKAKGFNLKKNVYGAAEVLQGYFTINEKDALNILAKSLLFNSFDHMESCMEKGGDWDTLYVSGIFYSEYILAKELNISTDASLILKGQFDKLQFNNSGHIFYADPLSIISFLANKESQSRSISTKFPISIYLRSERLGLIFTENSKVEIRSFWVKYLDEIYVPESYLGYFLDSQKNINQIIASIFRNILEHDTLVFPHYFLDTLKNSYRDIYVEFFVEFGYKIHDMVAYGYTYYLITHDKTVLDFLGKKEHNLDLMKKVMYKLKCSRIKAGFTQQYLADMSGVSVRSIGYMESGNKSPSYEIVLLLSKALKIDINDLF